MIEIEERKEHLAKILREPVRSLAQKCSNVWHDVDELDRVLSSVLVGDGIITKANLLYCIATDGHQLSSNITLTGCNRSKQGQDLSARPYLSKVVPADGFILSDVYINDANQKSCITVVNLVQKISATAVNDISDEVLGFLAVDFDLKSLPEGAPVIRPEREWRQIKGDPAIRGTLFMQTRERSPMDDCMDTVIAIMDELITERGVFHGKLHYASSRATMWMTSDPYHYRVHVLDEIIHPDVCLRYPHYPYPEDAAVPTDLVRPIFERFKVLREADETVYLRAGSLNVINGMVSLTFSCDGSHYLPAEEFMERGEEFWFGESIE